MLFSKPAVGGAPGVGTRQEVRQRQREQTSTNWVSRYSNGLCRTGVYFVGVPTTECVSLPLRFALTLVPDQPCFPSAEGLQILVRSHVLAV